MNMNAIETQKSYLSIIFSIEKVLADITDSNSFCQSTEEDRRVFDSIDSLMAEDLLVALYSSEFDQYFPKLQKTADYLLDQTKLSRS